MLLILTKAWIIFTGRLFVPRPVRMFSVWPFQSLVGYFHNNFFVSSFNFTVWTYHPTFFFVSRVRSRRSKYHFHKLFGFPSSSLSGKWDSQSCRRKREIINMLIKTKKDLCLWINALPDLISSSPYCLSYNCHDFSWENLVLDQLIIPLLKFFFILITFLLDIVL